MPTLVTPGDPVSDFRTQHSDLFRNRNSLNPLLNTPEDQKDAFTKTAQAYIDGAQWARKRGDEKAGIERDVIAKAAGQIALALREVINEIEGVERTTEGVDWV